MKLPIRFVAAFALSIYCGTSWSAPPSFLKQLQSSQTLEEVRRQTELIAEWNKLKLLCEASARPSLNPHCYELAKFESSNWRSYYSGQFPQWWEENCSQEIDALSWPGLLLTDWKELPKSCQQAWHKRHEELIYRFSKEDVNLLWRHRH